MSIYQKKCTVINKKLPVFKSVSVNKTNFFIIYLVPAILFLLFTKFIKNCLQKYIIFGHRNTEILLIIFSESNAHNFSRLVDTLYIYVYLDNIGHRYASSKVHNKFTEKESIYYSIGCHKNKIH